MRIVLTPFLRLTAKREERGREKHLEEVLTSLDEVFELSSSHVWIVDGRWGTTVSSDVPETLVCETVGGADYAVVRLKVQAYRDYLAAR